MKNSIRLEVSIDDQRLDVLNHKGDLLRSFSVSTAKKGVGFREESFRTPTGRFRICEKIGDGEKPNTIFKQRVPAGIWKKGTPAAGDLVLTRILRLDGLDPENANSKKRCIYIHGTNREDLIGRPASIGCVRLSNAEMVELYDMVPEKTSLYIHPPGKKRGKLIFFDCDSTLSSIEGIDELARSRGPEVYADVVALTNAAMNGEVPLDEVFPRRMEIIRPDKATCDHVAAKYIKTMVPGVPALIKRLKKDGWLPVILSGGFAPLIEPLAKHLGIDHVEAVPLFLDKKGNYAGYGVDFPTTRNLGKNEIIREWKAALLPERTAMIGDGISDLETTPDVDVFIGFGGVVARPAVKKGARRWITDMRDRDKVIGMLETGKKATVTRGGDKLSVNISRKLLSEVKPRLASRLMSTSSKKEKPSKGKRYSSEEKNDIVSFVEKHNAENGRGGQSAAAKKFGISQLTIASWLKSNGTAVGKRGGKAAVVKSAKGGSISAKLSALAALATKIDKAEAELAKLKGQFKSLKAGL